MAELSPVDIQTLLRMELFTFLVWLSVAAAQISNDLLNFEAFSEQRKFLAKKKYRPLYHITAPEGWLNDPTGMTYYNHQYHVFYQYHPYNGAWGHIHWGHVVSSNLVDWVYYPPALVPKEFYEKHGCLSGSALVHNNYLTLFYTGSVVLNNMTQQNQNVAISSDGVTFQKYLYNPIVKQSPYAGQGVGDFRNPKVWRFHNNWYMLVGATSDKRQGQLLLYTSKDMFNWKLHRIVAESFGDMGYMWESPDLFELEGQHVLLLSVRGVQTDGYRFRNLYQTGYVLGVFDHQLGKFDEIEVSTATFNELDYGHDFYAAQTLQTYDGRQILFAWLGMWETALEESKDGWASMLTIPRELKLFPSGRIHMTPIRELVELRTEVLEDAWYSPGEAFYAGAKSFEMIVNSSTGANQAVLILEWSDKQYSVEFSASRGFVRVDRGGLDGVRRADWSPPGDHVHWRIFVDNSCVEVFCGSGEVVFSSRIYPKKALRIRIGGDTQLHIIQYRLKRSLKQEYDGRFKKEVEGTDKGWSDFHSYNHPGRAFKTIITNYSHGKKISKPHIYT